MAGYDKPPTLLTLPLELRQMIYEWTFEDQVVDISKNNMPSAARNAGLLLACRQTHEEAIKRYYKHSIFFTPHSVQLGWLETIPLEYRNLIQELRCAIDFCRPCIIRYSTNEGRLMKYTWRALFRKQFIIAPLKKMGLVLREGVVKVDVELKGGGVIWSAEPENWLPLEWEQVPEEEEAEWEIEEMART